MSAGPPIAALGGHASAKSESNDISTLTAMGGLATTLRELERLKEAEKMASDALSGCQRLSMSQQVLLASAACKCCLQVLLVASFSSKCRLPQSCA